MEKQQFTEITDDKTEATVKHEDAENREAQTIILQMNRNEEEGGIDLLNVVEGMGKRWKAFFYLLIIAVCVGFLMAALITAIKGLVGKDNYASAVIAFSFDGIEEGLDPNGGLFDVNKMKSTVVIDEALKNIGWRSRRQESGLP